MFEMSVSLSESPSVNHYEKDKVVKCICRGIKQAYTNLYEETFSSFVNQHSACTLHGSADVRT